MKKGNFGRFKAFIVLVLALSLQLPAFAFVSIKRQNIDASNLIQLTNCTSKHVTITGTVTGSQITDHSKVIYLNFGKNFNTSLSAVIYDVDMHSFADAGIDKPQIYFKNKKVRLEGVIRVANGKPEVVISSPRQIKIIE